MSELERTTVTADSTAAIARSLGVAALGDENRTRSANLPLLLALADDESAAAAIRVTLALARERGALPSVVRALGTFRDAESALSPIAGTMVEECFGEDDTLACRDAVAQQLNSVAGQLNWPIQVSVQTPIEAIVEQARQLRAGMIVMGLRRHGVLQRALSRDLLGEVVRVTRVPVLAVRPEFPGLPKRIVVAVDFGGASVRAAYLARQLLSDDGAMYLVHVSMENSERVRAMLDALADELAPAPSMTVTSILLHGDVQSSIEGLAQAVTADLVAVGSERQSPFDRLATSALSMKLAHTARWSTLIVPPRRED